MSEHRQEFDNELEAIEGKVIELFAMVAEGLPTATQALLNGDAEAYPLLAARDQVIDALYLEVEGLANREILLQAPVASDLRFLLLFPIFIPALLGLVEATTAILLGDSEPALWIKLLAGYDVIFTTVSLLLFSTVLNAE